MSKPYTKENLPAEYPVDNTLMFEAETTVGIDAHDRNAAIGAFRASVANFKRDPGGHTWFVCLKWERQLRGLVAEAKMNRLAVIKPLHS